MSFRSIISDVRESIGSFSRRRGKEVRISGEVEDLRGKISAVEGESTAEEGGRWARLPPELLRDVIKRLEESESTWPARKHVVACASVCMAWRVMCKEIVSLPEFCGKLTFPVSLKQPGPREGTIQCFIKRDRSKSRYHLFLCLSPALLAESGKFLLAAKRVSGASHTDYVISMDADNISRSGDCFLGKLRSNFLGTKFIVYEPSPMTSSRTSRRFYSKVAPKTGASSCTIAQVAYELNVLGKRGPRRMRCSMLSIPAAVMGLDGSVAVEKMPEDSFRSISFSKSAAEFGSARFSEAGEEGDKMTSAVVPLILRNKAPRWHEQLQCWCLNFRGRVTVASVKNFQLIADGQTPGSSEHDKIILQFGKVGKDTFTMDYRYPLSAFQAFAICLSSFDTKLACE